MKTTIALVSSFIVLSGCLTTSEVALAPNVLRIDAEAGGAAFVGKANAAMMNRAATATINRGYTHFVTGAYDRQTGSEIVYMSSNTYGTGDSYGYRINSFAHSFNANTQTNVWRAPTEKTSILIKMFKKGDKIPEIAWNAQEVLAKKEKCDA